MEHNEVRDSLNEVPTFTLPPPPRFDEAASAAARPVEPLLKARILVWLHPSLKFLRISRRSKLLALMAVVGLATGAAGGMLVVERDRQQRFTTSSMIPSTDAKSEGLESATPLSANDEGPASLEPSVELVQAKPTPRRSRRVPRRQLVVASEDWDQDKADEEDKDKDKDDDDRRKDRDRDGKDRDRDADSDRSERSRRGALLYDVIRTRKP